MLEVGRLAVKIAGRDAKRKCVVVDIVDDNHVLIDGDVRRKKCNNKHLEPLGETIAIKKGASHEEVAKEFEKLNLPVWSTKPKAAKPKPGKAEPKPAAEKPEAPKKKPAKKASKTSKKKE